MSFHGHESFNVGAVSTRGIDQANFISTAMVTRGVWQEDPYVNTNERSSAALCWAGIQEISLPHACTSGVAAWLYPVHMVLRLLILAIAQLSMVFDFLYIVGKG